MEIVGLKNFKIVANKFFKGFIYSFIVFTIVVAMSYVAGGGLPLEYAAYGSLIYAFLESLLKFFKKYEPEYYKKFEWLFTPFFKALFEKIKG